jgi:ubiquinone/menaquinone biosynthesis C-methylase UbiE
MSSRRYFDVVAQQWDKMREAFFSDAVRDKAISLAGVKPERLAADIGAGTGFMTEGLIQRGLRVIAVDQSEAMLREMGKKFQGIDRFDYRPGEAENLPIEDKVGD